MRASFTLSWTVRTSDILSVMNVVLAVIQNNKRVLIAQRDKKEKGLDESVLTWVFPGGQVEETETKENAVIREVLEETGLKVKSPILISSRKHPQFPVLIHYYSFNTTDDKTKPGKDIKQLKWVNPKEIPSYFTTNFDKNVARYLKVNN